MDTARSAEKYVSGRDFERPDPRRTALLSCSSLRPFVDAAQKKEHTAFPVIEADRKYHADPEEMKRVILDEIGALPPEYDTVLVAMAFCGGAWDRVTAPRRIVIPRADDCVSILLDTDDEPVPNRKEPGHLYIYEPNPGDFSALKLMRDYSNMGEEYRNMDPEMLFHMWFDQYRHMDIIDTGISDCYTEEYAASAQEEADRIHADLDYVPGSNRMLEKLVSGRWDGQFIVAEPGHLIRHADFFG